MMNRQQIKQRLQTVLDLPGVYKMLDEYGNILYIGKSIALKTRVSSYLAKEIKRGHKIQQMLVRLWDVEVYYTDTELDALLLECKWIKFYRPPYNTALMHTERYGYLIVESSPHYRIRWSKTRPEKALRVIGPLTQPRLSRQAQAFFESQYPFMCCKNKIEECMKNTFGKCEGYCAQDVRAQRLDFIDQALAKESPLPAKLMTQIEGYSEAWEFEKAGTYYEYLRGLNYIRGMYEMLERLESQSLIGRLPIQGTLFYKYYLILNGVIYHICVGMAYEEAEIVEHLRTLTQDKKVRYKVRVLKENIDEVKILYSFIERKMYRIEV
ncbi:MAG: GIY-YIG nuclease family protein [Niameybacter sp.]|uniref:GIY-YIG nuclease family protein n=2 Tax=Niameybacter sp. TaxID=2033640 RepID=UPI002FC613D1